MLQHPTKPPVSGQPAHRPAACWRELWRTTVIAVLATVALAAPAAIAQTPLSGATVVSAGGGHTCIVAGGGAARCWGANGDGQIGDNSTTQRLVVTNVSGLASGATAISAGALHTCALVSGGVKCWGENGSGELGDDTNTQRLIPVAVTGLGSGVAKIEAGGSHTCAVTTGGGLKCWGFNGSGQIGDNSFANRDVPVDVVGLTSGVAAVTAGSAHTCALTTGGGVKCWGDNFSSQLGDDTNVGKQTPVDVSGLTSGVAAISAGGLHTCALTTGGGVKCWGQNEHGQLGDGTTGLRDVPVDVTGLTSGVAAISVGAEFSCALTTGGGVKCWGFNDSGQLGDNSMDQRLTPVDVTGLTSGVSAIAAGDSHACALVAGGGVKCWGLNINGPLGNNSTDTSLVPVSALQASVPGAPVIGTATAGVQQASVTFGAPMSDGGNPITGYTVTASPAAGVDSNAGSTSTTHIVTGLTAGVSYTFTVTATNAQGTSVPSAPSNAVIPTGPTVTVDPATVPGGTFGVLYATQNLSGSGGTGPYTFAVTAGALPNELTLTPAGVLSGTPSAAGMFNFTVTATDSTPMGSGGPLTGTRAYSSTIAKANQTITFGALSNKALFSAPFGVSATATSNLTVSFSSQTMAVCTVAGSTVTLVATGTCTIRASQAGDDNWFAAPNVDQSFQVTPPPITVNPATVPNGTVGVLYAQQQLTGSGAAGPYTFAVTAGALPGGLTLTPAGLLSGTPTAAGAFNFTVTATDSSAPGTGGPFTGSRAYGSTIAQGSQTITFGALGAKVLGSPPFGVSATASSGLTVSFSSQTLSVCTVSGSTVTLVAVGTCTIRASQGGNANWLAALNVDQSFMVSASPVTVNPATVPGGTVGVVYATQNFSGSGGTDPYTFAVTAGVLPGGLTLTTAGVLSGTPNAAGTFNFTVAATDSTPGGSGGPFTGTRAYSGTIAQGTQSITFGMLPSKVLGSAPFGVNATATSGLPVSFSSLTMSVCTVSGNTVTLVAVGSCTIRASQAGDANWLAAVNVDQSFMVTTPPITITPPTLPGGTFGVVYPTQNLSGSGAGSTPPYTFAVTAGALPGGLTLTPAGVLSGTPTAAGNFNFTVTVTDSTPPGSGGPVTGTWGYALEIAMADQTITFDPLPNRVIGTPAFMVSATATSDLAVSFESTTMAVCTVAGSTVTLVTTGTCTIRASQSGNANWNAAANVDQSFTVLEQAVLDIDGNKLYRPLTDGLLVIRYLFGLEGPPLTINAIGAGATRMVPEEVFAYLESIRPQLDIDLNGLVRPLTDGLLIIRYLFGLKGDALVANAVGAGAMRNTQQIEEYIQSLMPVVP